jgi:hypothetical protein
MTTKNAATATNSARPGLLQMLATLETELLNLCALADALAIIACALPCLDGTEAPHEKRAFHALDAMIDLLSERADLVYEINAQAALIAADPARMAAA